MKRACLLILFVVLCSASYVNAQPVISDKRTPGSFAVMDAVIYVDANDFELVKKSALLYQADVEMVTGRKLSLVHTLDKAYKAVIAIGSITNSAFLKELIRQK